MKRLTPPSLCLGRSLDSVAAPHRLAWRPLAQAPYHYLCGTFRGAFAL